jgi:hypothetical protein
MRMLSQLDDGDISSVNEHRIHHWVTDSTSQSFPFDMAGTTTGVETGSSFVQPVFNSLQRPFHSQMATASVAAKDPRVTGTKLTPVLC